MKKQILPLLVVFLIVNAVVLGAKAWLTEKGVDIWVVLIGNLLLFLASLLVFWLYFNAMKSPKTYGFVRQVYTGFMIKFFVLIAGAVLYFYFAEEVNNPAIFICMAIYLVYNFLGTSQVVNKKQKHKSRHH